MKKDLEWEELTDIVKKEYGRLIDATYPILEPWQTLKYMAGKGLVLFDEGDPWAVIEVIETESEIGGDTMIYRIRSGLFYDDIDKLIPSNPDDAVILLESILSDTRNLLTPQNRSRAEKLIPVLSKLNPLVRWSLSKENVVVGDDTAVCVVMDLTQNTAAVQTVLEQQEEKWFLLREGCVEGVAARIVDEWEKQTEKDSLIP